MSPQLWQLMALRQEKHRQTELARQQELQRDLDRVQHRRRYLESVIADSATEISGSALNGNHLSAQSGYMRQLLTMRHQLQQEEERLHAELLESNACLRAYANEERKFGKLEELARQKLQRQEDKLQAKESDELNIALFNQSRQCET